LSVYYVQATPGLFRKIQAKKRDEAIRNRLSDDWIRGWANKARMTDEKVNQMFGDSSWSYMCSVAFGFAQARELNGGMSHGLWLNQTNQVYPLRHGRMR